MEVELYPAEPGQFMILIANDNGDSVQSFTPASRVTFSILVSPVLAVTKWIYLQSCNHPATLIHPSCCA
ncbi:hypothetical protein WJX77_002749 [Trebouxia sp. C0004]